MSDLAAAAAAMGVPEPIAERSARARAAATGQTYEQIIAAWAGGQPVAGGAAPEPEPEPAPTDTPAESPAEVPVEETPAAAAPTVPTAPAQPEAPAAAMDRRGLAGPAPILDVPADRPLFWLVGGVAVVVLTMLLGFVFPSLPAQSNEVRSSNLPLTETAQAGRTAYLRAGCASCHTQVVRSVVADVGLGAATLADTNQVTGFRRVGPDLANVGARLGPDEIAAAITGGDHPPLALSDDALGSVVAYLSEGAAPSSGGDS